MVKCGTPNQPQTLMETSDIFAAIEKKKEAEAKAKADLLALWKPFEDAIRPVMHLFCMPNIKLTQTGLYDGDGEAFYVEIGLYDNVTSYVHRTVDQGRDCYIFNKFDRSNKFAFEKALIKFCADHVRSEEFAQDWHENRKKEEEDKKMLAKLLDNEEEWPSTVEASFFEDIKRVFKSIFG